MIACMDSPNDSGTDQVVVLLYQSFCTNTVNRGPMLTQVASITIEITLIIIIIVTGKVVRARIEVPSMAK